ncbi:MAG: diguanylate cyclase [Rhizobiaceae bacterium]|nr:diguanylate cyclase [Rhizobiaceae bacterium]
MTSFELATSFLQGFGIVGLVSFAYSAALACNLGRSCKIVAIPFIFGVGTAATMWLPIVLAPGLLFDLRHVFIVLSALFGGWPSLAVTTVVSAVMRFWQGGAGATAGLLGIGISALVGVAAIYILRERAQNLKTLSAMAVLASASMVSIFVLPWEVVMLISREVLGPTVFANFIGVLLAGHILETHRRRYARQQRLTEEAFTDALTGLANRRTFDTNGPRLVDEAAASGLPYVMMIIDIDHFKSVNDRFGHDVGDLALQHVAQVVSLNVRRGDIAARYGGEEIVLLLFGYDRHEAQNVADRIRTAIADSPVELEGSLVSMTVSVGVHMPAEEEPFSRTFQRADRALYKAKRNGRDRVEFAQAA